ncbi:MAG: sulfite dehydrogenase [Rhodospirillaceae bacterium]|nr:sulfite dehydrogenase [Rhodospirillaceae bacterium]|tara:strand:+ start:2462 stop:3778 length:1317 start_codon:yes stop_codon:yes gene_type:complete
MSKHSSIDSFRDLRPAAANGLYDRRAFLKGGTAFATAIGGYTLSETLNAQSLVDDPWSASAGTPTGPYEARSRFENSVVRTMTNPNGEPRSQQSRTPHHMLDGTFTPNGLHFVISRSGPPDIDPDQHRLAIHGLVKQPLIFTLDSLMRYPMVSRMAFVECGGNSAPMWSPEPLDANVQALHGLVSSAEWSGVMLSTLLEEAGIEPSAKWLIAEGSDSLALHRSVPLSKALDDAMIAMYQNGERLMPGNGYPMRLLLPGWEGNMNVKWLRRIELVDQPAMSIYEARTYAPILPGGKAYQFYFLQEVKSFITHPSPGLLLSDHGFYEISGIAYSANGRISKVMVSADGGESWAEAELQAPVLPKAFTRFRIPWQWDGGPAVLQSRAWDEAGYVQPTRSEIVAARGEASRVPNVNGFPSQHYNGPTSWQVNQTGEVKHVYA